MNDIEELLRESLHSAPTPQPRLTDPVATIERRAGRARAFIAGGALAAVAVISAAVVVPLQLTNDNDGPSRLGGPTATQPPSPGPGSTNHPPQVWFKGGSTAMTSGGGSLWHLHKQLNTTQDVSAVDKVDPATHRVLATWPVQAPADFISYGAGRVWVMGGGDGGYPNGLLQSIDPTDGSKTSWSNPHHAFNGVAFAGGRAWASTGHEVWELDVPHDRSSAISVLPADSMQHGLVVTQTGQLWVRTEKKWLRIDTTSHQIVDTVQWTGQMYGAAGGDAIWTYDGRLIALSPSLLHQGISVAEGSRIAVPGLVQAVAPSSDGGLFVVAYSGQDAENDPSTLYYLNERALTGTAGINDETPKVPDAQPYQLAPDNAGGVNYTDTDVGTRWVP